MKYLLSLMLLSIMFFTHASFAQEEFSSAQIKQYKQGIFEVVTLKLEDKTTYKDEFPFDLIPFQFRNDKYHSLGTAFLIDDKTFVSAAHVFGLEQYSQLSAGYALRDTKGNIFEIDEIQKFSNYRDVIQFTVKEKTSDYYQFAFADDYEEGDVVYTAGNALGEGVIFRKGTLSSFTFEPINGKWKDIRFSAAASPGNSGGPLLNLNGEVVGIVTRKSENENLNYALPVKEFSLLPTDQAEFFENQMAEIESTKQHRFTWKFTAKLPQKMQPLRIAAQKSYFERFASGRTEFEERHGSEIYPAHPNVEKYLYDQSSDASLAIIDINGNGEWSLFEAPEEKHIKITNKQSLWFSANDKIMGNYQFFLEKPEEMPLNEFISNPKVIVDTFVTSVKWNRSIAQTPVYISSYGEPVLQESHTDIYGRTWHMSVFNDTYANRSIMTYCLPIPRGVACDFVTNSSAWLRIQRIGYKDNLARMMLSYSAKLSEWQEFLALPKTKLPSLFHDAEVKINEGKVALKMNQFSGVFDNIDLDDQSYLYVAVEVAPQNTKQLVASYFSLTPKLNEDGFYSVSKYYDLKEDASDNYADFWAKFVSQQSPYDFSIMNKGETLSKKMNLSAKQKAPVKVDEDARDFGFLATCELESSESEDDLNKKCDAFIDGLTLL